MKKVTREEFLVAMRRGEVSGVVFPDIDLSGLTFTGRTNLWDDGILPRVNLTGTDLRSTLLYKAIMKGAVLDGTDLSPSGEDGHLSESDWQGCDLSRALVRNRSNLNHVMFGDTKWINSRIISASMDHAYFESADLQGLRIGSGVILREVFFGLADLRGANLSQATVLDWSTIYLRDAIMDERTKMPKGFEPKHHHIQWA
jgi:uncharacterized protein YjbI with pentapeptide repeats